MYISIVIPTRNRAHQIERTLESVASLECNDIEFELIIVDNGSTDHTSDVVENFRRKNGGILTKYFFDEEPGLLTGRHRGAKEAAGEILSFIDDDVILSPGWLSAVNSTMKSRPDITFLTGPNLPLYEVYPPEWLEYFWSDTPYGGKLCGWLSLLDLKVDEVEIHPNYVWGLNFTIRKTDLYQLGGFHPDNIPAKFQMFQGDGETGLTMKGFERGKKALYHKGLMLHHQTPKDRLTLEYFDKRAFYQGICNSFSDIRSGKGKVAPPVDDAVPMPANFAIRPFLGKLKRKLVKEIRDPEPVAESTPSYGNLLQERFNAKMSEGYQFHQKMAETNQAIKDWVLRENYFDYKLPSL